MYTDLDLDFEHGTIEEDIVKNQSQLAAAEEAVRRCRKRQYQLRRDLNTARSVLSSLPKEVMSQIFLFMCSLADSPFGLWMFKPDQFLIGSVCKEWREIAWSTPRLWNIVYIWFREKSWKTQIELLEEWIERSGNLPLDIYIHSMPKSGTPWEPPTETFTRVTEVCARWRSFDGSAAPGLAVALKRTNATRFPMLETLTLSESIHAPPVNNPPDTTYLWNFLPAPALRNVSIKTPLLGANLTINWESLTCLKAAFILQQPDDPAQRKYIPFDVLSSCKQLTELELDLMGSGVSSTQQIHHCHFPHLKVLKINGLAVIVDCVLGWLKTPSLNELEICLESVDTTIQWEESLIDLTERSSCKISSLSIKLPKNELDSDADIVEMLRTLSRNHPIDSLEICSSIDCGLTLSNAMVFLLTMKRQYDDEKRKEHLPLLKNFYYNGDVSLSSWEYARMVNSRLTYEARKRKAHRMGRKHGMNVSVLGESTKDENGNNQVGDEVDECGDKDEIDQDEGDDGEQLDNSSVSNPLTFKIHYRNRNWFQAQHPNSLQSFYSELERFSTRGNRFVFKYLNYYDDDENYFYYRRYETGDED
ncbi:hypothetical protein JR316_0013054 [Psilocybe cubensis]|uniref:F-box domain-containing protein n=2 Tax=Psilocybe cubensis TaxID=181762 RepID=A0A8H7XUF3_PSICU|nr:hypothetical protein JR316_0013054 [Psilocybe cubensis]KAH9474592.1 hypothetical protein JR316_0013054 [Psilocybe cubensis]